MANDHVIVALKDQSLYIVRMSEVREKYFRIRNEGVDKMR